MEYELRGLLDLNEQRYGVVGDERPLHEIVIDLGYDCEWIFFDEWHKVVIECMYRYCYYYDVSDEKDRFYIESRVFGFCMIMLRFFAVSPFDIDEYYEKCIRSCIESYEVKRGEELGDY